MPPLVELEEVDEELVVEDALLDEVDDELVLDDELLLDELDELLELPLQSPIGPPPPPWLLQVWLPIQLALLSQPQPVVWFWHIGYVAPYQLHWQAL